MGRSESGIEVRLVAAAGLSADAAIGLGARTTVGRAAECDICINDQKISRLHAVITVQDGEVAVEDMNSTNGTWVNDERIDRPTGVKDGDSLRFQNYSYQINITTTTAASPPASSAEFVDQQEPDERPMQESDEAPLPELDDQPAATDELSVAAVSGRLDSAKPRLPGSWINADSSRVTRVLNASGAASKDMSEEVKATLASRFTDRPHLVAVSDDEVSAVFGLATSEGRDVWEIGRDANCEIVLDESSVSGKHAQLVHENGSWRLVNLVSANGTLVNGERCLDAFLADGDVLDLGLAKLVFHVGAEASAVDESIQVAERKPARAVRRRGPITTVVLVGTFLGLVGLVGVLWLSGVVDVTSLPFGIADFAANLVR